MLDNFRTYKLAVKLYREVSTLPMPRHLKDQLLRAASSVVLNLAEGDGKRTSKDRRRFFEIAWGSLQEVTAILDLAQIASGQTLDDARSSLCCLLKYYGKN